MWAIIGIIIGIVINHAIILPIEREQARKWCKQREIVPEEDEIYYSITNNYGNMREPTTEERKGVYKYVNFISEPTGISFYKENDTAS